VVAGDAGQFGINTGLILRGMDLAMVSGLAAARAILETPGPDAVGPAYLTQLEALALLPTMRVYAECHGLFELSRLFGAYPALANEALEALFSVDGKVPPPMLKQLWQVVRSHVSLGQMLSDAWKGFRSV
jgi:electron transfer flavoprotein-quinone oxidoreductase